MSSNLKNKTKNL